VSSLAAPGGATDVTALSRRRLLGLAGTALTAGLAGCSDALGPGQGARAGVETGAVSTDSPTPTPDDGTISPYTRVYRQTIGSVVLVEVPGGQGSGFLYDDRHLVTNQHVVGEADATRIRFSRGEYRSGRVVGRDEFTDLAVVAVDDPPGYADPLSLAEESAVIGTEVVVLGNPFGLDDTVTAGIVSGVDRSIPSPAGFAIPDAVQTDAAANPGNSGGPMVDLAGVVVAVISSGGGDNIAFGISAALARRVVPALIEDGVARHAYLGVRLAEVTPDVATAAGLDAARGALVAEVEQGGPSAGALRRGDVVVALDEETVATTEDLSSYLALETAPGQAVAVAVVRDGERQTVEVTLGARRERRGA
jgi:S1-C subfamily serine protease